MSWISNRKQYLRAITKQALWVQSCTCFVRYQCSLLKAIPSECYLEIPMCLNEEETVLSMVEMWETP